MPVTATNWRAVFRNWAIAMCVGLSASYAWSRAHEDRDDAYSIEIRRADRNGLRCVDREQVIGCMCSIAIRPEPRMTPRIDMWTGATLVDERAVYWQWSCQ